MCASLNSVDVLTIFVTDLARSKDFYHEVFGLSAVFENENSAVYNFDNLSLNLLVRASAPDLVAPEQVAEPGGVGVLFTVNVDNVDETCAELVGRGAKILSGPIDRPWGVRTASFADPDGYLWEVAQ